MTFKNTPNKCYQTTCGKSIWDSRNVAVSVTIVRPNPDDLSKLQVLAVKRGKAVSDSGKWCLPCGYLDRDETTLEAAIREAYEETGISIERDKVEFLRVDDCPTKKLQNVTIDFGVFCPKNESLNPEIPDPSEVEEVRWVNILDYEKFDWAFDHDKSVSNIVSNG